MQVNLHALFFNSLIIKPGDVNNILAVITKIAIESISSAISRDVANV